MIKAILFDMDGVLIDAKDWHYEAFNRAVGIFGMEISRYDHIRSFDGLPTKEKLKLLSLNNYLPVGLHPFLNKLKQKYTMEMIHSRCKPRFDHEYALSHLKKQGYRIAVCSNSIRKTIETMMEYASLTEYLDLIVSNEDVIKSKPDPEMYQTAMKKLDLLPTECLIVEDNPNGILAAKRSGGYVMEVETVADVNYRNIVRRIRECNN